MRKEEAERKEEHQATQMAVQVVEIVAVQVKKTEAEQENLTVAVQQKILLTSEMSDQLYLERNREK
ncbi:MAG TPA: hypothetical protein EYQ00_13920 [Dehalococcoidia bacterium]|nr:hypothetical protein [Dehalococcoidia bacterium]